MTTFDITKLDLYEILGVSELASEKQIVKSYRKQALKCHPDKNPDNPKAAELFHKLSKALEVLTDAAARAAYDKIQKAKKAAEQRHRELDSKRKKLKEDLEARESVAQTQKEADISAKRNLQAEIERLRKEGSKLLEQEQEFLLEEIRRGRTEITEEEEDTKTPKLKIKWKSKKGDEENGGYSYTVLYSLFVKYGDILNLLVSSKKNGSAIIEFSSRTAAEVAVENEKGLNDNPLTVIWLEGKTPQKTSTTTSINTPASDETTRQASQTWSQQNASQERDYEDLVLMKLRQAEERKRLIEQMKNEDDDS